MMDLLPLPFETTHVGGVFVVLLVGLVLMAISTALYARYTTAMTAIDVEFALLWDQLHKLEHDITEVQRRDRTGEGSP